MKNTFYAVVAASLAMLATSGIVALATAAPSNPRVKPPVVETEFNEAEMDAWISAQINAEYRKTFAVH